MNTYPFYQRIGSINKLILVGHLAVPDDRDVWHFAAHTPPRVHLGNIDEVFNSITAEKISYSRVRSIAGDMFIAEVELKVKK
jgi:hypothetical protein